MPIEMPRKPTLDIELGYCHLGCGAFVMNDQEAYELGYVSVDGTVRWSGSQTIRSHFLTCPTPLPKGVLARRKESA